MNIEYDKDEEIKHYRDKISELERKRTDIFRTLVEPIDNEIVMWREKISDRRQELRK